MKLFISKITGLVLDTSEVIAFEPEEMPPIDPITRHLVETSDPSHSTGWAYLRNGKGFRIYPDEIVEFIQIWTGQDITTYNQGVTHIFPH